MVRQAGAGVVECGRCVEGRPEGRDSCGDQRVEGEVSRGMEVEQSGAWVFGWWDVRGRRDQGGERCELKRVEHASRGDGGEMHRSKVRRSKQRGNLHRQ